MRLKICEFRDTCQSKPPILSYCLQCYLSSLIDSIEEERYDDAMTDIKKYKSLLKE